MSSLLPINPADFPDVPTKKALIAIDLQNDFLAEDGALPVNTPDGMIENIIKLAAAVRNSGYGEVVWVRSQFDTNRAVGDQQIVVAETTQIPPRPGASAATTAARARMSRASPLESTPLEADPEAFLSLVRDPPGTGRTKPQCVRKGTPGAEFLPAIAEAKGPADYAMTKTYYSAFQSGQLLHLLRRHFATELYICGSLCNVSVYATALAASSYGFDITIVEDCCGYRSEMRHMNARRKLTELTGCEYATAADIIPTLRPKSPSPKADGSHPSGARISHSPAPIPPSELIAAAMAENRKSPGRGGQGISVRPKSSQSPATPPPNTHRMGEKGREVGNPAALPSLPSPEDLSPGMEKLRLNAAESTGPLHVSVAAREKPRPGPPQSPAEPKVQPVVKATRERAGDKGPQLRASAQGRESGSDIGQVQLKDMMAAIEASRNKAHSTTGKTKITAGPQENKPIDAVVDKVRQKLAPLSTADDAPTTSEMSGSKLDEEFNPTEELLTAETPDHMVKGEWPAARGKKDISVSPSAQSSTHNAEDSESAISKETTEDASHLVVKDATVKPDTSEYLCEGDTTLTHPFLPTSILSGLFERLCTEVHFLKMMHQGGEVPRFVAVQGSVSSDGTQPVYRHPSDETLLCVPFTPAVQAIREEVEKRAGHEMNHVLIQCYRGGNDYISEHSDKTLDIVDGSYIANVSLGAERTMVFRTKRDASRKETATPGKTAEASGEKDDPTKDDETETPATPLKLSAPDTTSPSKRQTTRVPLPHNSLLRMGLSTNAKWLHGIRPDKRPLSQRTPAELAFSGYRISLTFRHIGTFLSPPPGATGTDADPLIWGQGAVAKTREAARPVVNGQTDQAVALLRAFGRENNSPTFGSSRGDAGGYGPGFDVLHMNSAPRYLACGDTMADGRVRIALAELGVRHSVGTAGTGAGKGLPPPASSAGGLIAPVKFEVDGAGAGGDRAAVTGDVAILLYLDARHPRKKGGEADTARVYTRFCAVVALGHKWKALWADDGRARGAAAAERRDLMRAIFRSSDMGTFDGWLSESLGRLAGGSPPSPSSPSPFSSSSPSPSPSHSPPFSSSSSETGEVFLAGGAEPSIADYAFWPLLHEMANEWRRAGGGFEETWVERGRYTALEKYYVDFSGRRSVVGVFGERVGALLAAAPEGKKKGQGLGGGDGDGNDGDGDGRGGDTGAVVEKQEPVGVGKGDL